MKDPGDFFEIPIIDYANLEGKQNMHLAYQALHQYLSQNKSELPNISSEEDFQKLLQICKDLNKKNSEEKIFSVESFDEDLIRKFCFYSRLEIVPMSCFLGGIVAQEVMKITGKFKPIHQFLYFDCVDLLKDWNPTEKKLNGGNSFFYFIFYFYLFFYFYFYLFLIFYYLFFIFIFYFLS